MKCESKLKDVIKAIVTIVNKFPSDIMNNEYLKDSCKDVLLSYNVDSDKVKKNAYILFNEIKKENLLEENINQL